MSQEPLPVRPIENLTLTVRCRNNSSKNPLWKKTFYIPLNRSVIEQHGFKDGEVLTVGIFRRKFRGEEKDSLHDESKVQPSPISSETYSP